MADNVLTLKLDKETTLPLLEGLGKSAYAIAVAHGFKGTEQEWLDSLRGPQGPQGGTGPQGAEGPQGPRGPKGEPGSAEKTAELLKQKNIYLENANVDTVLSKIVELLGDQLKVTPKPLAYTQPTAGQTYVDLTGEPHFFVSVNGEAKQELKSDNIRVKIPAYGADDILINYFDLSETLVGGVTINGIEVAGDTTIEALNRMAKVVIKNGKATIDITKWVQHPESNALSYMNTLGDSLKGVTSVAIKSNEATVLHGEAGKIPIYLLKYLTNTLKFATVEIATPHNINVYSESRIPLNGNITVNGKTVDVAPYGYGYFKWNGSDYVWNSYGQL